MLTKLCSAASFGLQCLPVEVEVDINKGQTNFSIVGLTDTSIQEARERIHSAIKNSGYEYPFNFRILINLAPANLHKEGPTYDLPMAVGIILAHNKNNPPIEDALFIGELGLDGTLRHTTGILPVAIYTKQKGFKKIFVPFSNAAEAALVDDVEIYPAKNLKEVIDHLLNLQQITPHPTNQKIDDQEIETDLDMAFIKGQEFAKRALEIAASGNHNVLFSGPPGSGKTLLARTFPSILPALTKEETLEITKIYSVAGLLRDDYIKIRPFRAPHHTISNIALVGGGKFPRPGEISLAHRGVLFLDEFAEFGRSVLESLRQPLEDGIIAIARVRGTLQFPARFILIASQNPCPCGYYGDTQQHCTCSASNLIRYQKKISGPILDRIDLHIEVPRLKFERLSSSELAENSETIRARVKQARDIQNKRFAGTKIFTNAEMGNAEIKKYCQLNGESLDLLRMAVEQMHLSARSYNRILKIARTITDLSQSETILTEHLAEALQFRQKNIS